MASNDDGDDGFGFGFGDPPSSSEPVGRSKAQDGASSDRGTPRRGRRQRPTDGFSFLNPTDSQFEFAEPPRHPRRTVHPGTVIGTAAVALVVAFFAFGGGLPSALISLGLCFAGTAVYALISARPSWLRFRSRPVAALGLVGAVIITGVGASQLDPRRPAPAPATSSTTPSASHSASQVPAPVPTVSEPPAPTAPSVTSTPAAAGAVGDESPVIADRAAFDATALALLSTLPVKGRAPGTGYDRVGDFGEAWTDVDHNGCDTREDILTRDLTATDIAADCDVESGTLVSPYTGATIAFTRGYGTSAEVQIDHVVALSDAWQTGAQRLSEAQRISLANDPVNLLAVDGRSNQQKSDSDAASWLPQNKAYRCDYVARQVSVKVEYALWVTPPERDAMRRILEACPTMAAPVSPFVRD